MNEEKLNKYYVKIAEKLDEMIPIEWDRVVLFAEEFGDVSSANFYFYIKGKDKPILSSSIPEKFDVSEEIYDRLWRELIAINKDLWIKNKKEQQPWEIMIFYLDDDWKFKIEFEYEIDKEIDTYERLIRLAYNKLGIIPNDDYAKELLQEYLIKLGKSL